MKVKFVPSKVKLLGIEAIELEGGVGEHRIQGKYGWAHLMSNGRLYVAYTSRGQLALGSLCNQTVLLDNGGEHFTYLDPRFIKKVVEALKVPHTRAEQAAIANTWGQE